MKATFTATREEKISLLVACLSSGVPTLADAGFVLDTIPDEYKAARERLEARKAKGEFTDTICLEDIQGEIVNGGGTLSFHDTESDEVTNLTMGLIDENWDKTRSKDMLAYVNENYDAENTDNIIQCWLFGEIVYG